ncbi:MAG: hypothetical protein ACFFAS_15275 [Promethearchaeota archaeon]
MEKDNLLFRIECINDELFIGIFVRNLKNHLKLWIVKFFKEKIIKIAGLILGIIFIIAGIVLVNLESSFVAAMGFGLIIDGIVGLIVGIFAKPKPKG